MSTAFVITHTESVHSPTDKRETVTLGGLCALAKRTKADAKKSLPMFMGGTFNTSGRRRDKDMETITVVFGDCDNGSLSPAEALERFKAAKVIGAIITTPSHGPNGHRWRAVCPLHEPIPVEGNPAGFDLHAKLVRMLNGVLGAGVCGTEGTAASRPWYYGSLNTQPACETYVNEDGVCLDLSNVNEVAFPSSASERPPVTPVFANEAEAEDMGRIVLQAAVSFEGGHQGLRGACTLIAPFVRIGALDIEEAAEALHARLLETAHRRPEDIPDGEGMRFLRWAMGSDNVTAAVEHLETAIQLDEMTVTKAARKLGIRYVDSSDDFSYAEPLPDDPEEDAVVERSRKRSAFGWQSPDDLLTSPKQEWIIEGKVPAGSLVYLWGPPKSGKSFVALSLAVAVASGQPWFGKPVTKSGRVYYIMGEGGGGASQRVEAALDFYKVDRRLPLRVMTRAALLTDDGEADKLEASIRADADGDYVAMVFIDTLSRAIPGTDENSAMDMTKVVKRCDTMKENLKTTIVPVHHSSKDINRGMRGSLVLAGSADCSMKVIRDMERGELTGRVTLYNEFQKDAAEFAAMGFTMTPHMGSVVMVSRSLASREDGGNGPKVNPKHARLLAVLVSLRDAIPNSPVTTDDLIDECQDDTAISNNGKRCDRRRAVGKILAAAIEAGVIVRDGENLLPGAGGDLTMPPVDDQADD